MSHIAPFVETEWLAAERIGSTRWGVRHLLSTRKFLLLAVAICRRVWDRMPFEECRRIVEATERQADDPDRDGDDYRIAAEADGLFTALQEGHTRVLEAGEHARGAYLAAMSCGAMWHDPDGTIDAVADAAVLAVAGVPRGAVWEAELRAQARLLHELFGNPFRPVAFDPAWRTETAVGIARGIYDDRAFERLPILADALQEAGCEAAELLAHCREPGTHVRGCWVVDLVLGKG